MKDRNRSGKSGLIEKITKDSIKVELWISVSKWALPALGVGFLALFTWVWQTHADIVSIREQHVHAEKKLDSIEQRIAGRYTIDHAREDQRHSSKRMDAQVKDAALVA